MSGTSTDTSDKNLLAFASFLGASVDYLEPAASVAFPARGWTGATSPVGLALHMDTLVSMCGPQGPSEGLRRLFLSVPNLLIYGFRAGIHERYLGWLTSGLVEQIDLVCDARHGELPESGKCFTHQLGGAAYPRRSGGAEIATFPVTASAQPLITVSGKPTFLWLQQGTCNLFLSTIAAIPSPMQRVVQESDIEPYYDALLPVLIFIRAACQEFSWQGEGSAARLIIDDPALRRRYGGLDFGQLFHSLRQEHYGVTVAFIPWNHARTSAKTAPFFLNEQERFSICVHGCDHTHNEFGEPGEDLLLYKAQLANQRMRRHEVRTGIRCEPVMVFPQGRFSVQSLNALRATGIVAAINSTRFPVGTETAFPLQLSDLLLPAVTLAEGVAVFPRHYPTSTFPFLFDLFLGRPAFIVEHHDFFRQGVAHLETLVHKLNDCEPDLSWGPLADSVERTCWKRALSFDEYECRFFTDIFYLNNRLGHSTSFRLLKDELQPESVSSILLNGSAVPLLHGERHIQAEVTLAPGTSLKVQVRRREDSCRPRVNMGTAYESRVLLRRILSEFRDEFLFRHPVLLAAARRAASLLK